MALCQAIDCVYAHWNIARRLPSWSRALSERDEALVGADQPRSADPQGQEKILSDDQPFDKYPPFGRGRVMLALSILLSFGVALAIAYLLDS